MRRFKRSRSFRAAFCCRPLARLMVMANSKKDETIRKTGLLTSSSSTPFTNTFLRKLIVFEHGWL
jgi:hypothetical protein